MAFKLTTYDSLKIKGDVLITTKNYRNYHGINISDTLLFEYELFSVYKGNNNTEIVNCNEGILDYDKLFRTILNHYNDIFNHHYKRVLKHYKGDFDYENNFSSNTIVIPVEAFSAKANTFKSLYNGIYFNMDSFSKRSSVKVIFGIKPYLSFDNNSYDASIFRLDLNQYSLPREDYTDYDLANPMTPSVILNHLYNKLNDNASIKSNDKFILGVEEILDQITTPRERKYFAHIISPDQFKKMKNNTKGRSRKRFSKESLYRMALVLGLKLEHLLQVLNIEGYSFSPNDSLDIAIVNYYMRNKEISEPSFISFLKLCRNEDLEKKIINRLEEIKNLDGLI